MMADEKVIKELRAALISSQKNILNISGNDSTIGQERRLLSQLSEGLFVLPGAGASWRAEPQVVLTSEAVEASSWLGYSATVPATANNEQETR